MEQVKETWNLVFNWLGNGKKIIMGIAFVLIGVIGQSLSDVVLSQIPFVLMMMGGMCLVNALFSKISGSNINLLIYLIINVVIVEIVIGITASGVAEGVTLYGIWAACVVLAWILQIFVIRIEHMPKRVVLAFLETLLSALAMGLAFFLPIFLKAWRDTH